MKLIATTLHKSASVFLWQYFKHVAAFKEIQFYSESVESDELFKNRDRSENFIYSPYRFGVNDALLYETVSLDCLCLVHIRNPIDILVSEYYSYGFLHRKMENPLSGNDIVEYRERVKSEGIEKYCVRIVEEGGLDKFKSFYEFISKNIKNPNFIFSSYSCMKHNFKKWNAEIGERLSLTDKEIKTLFNRHNKQFLLVPLKNEEVVAGTAVRHIRNGEDRQYLTELKPETIGLLIRAFLRIIPFNIIGLFDDLTL